MSVVITDEIDIAFLRRSTYQADEPEHNHYARCLEESQQGKRGIYGAFCQDKPAGCVMLNWNPRYSVFQKLSIPEIYKICVWCRNLGGKELDASL